MFCIFQAAQTTYNVPQNLVPGVQNLNINDDKTPLLSTPVTNVQSDYNQSAPPPFLSGVPMVNPGNFTPAGVPPNIPAGQVNVQQQAVPQINPLHHVSQAQSVVSNMAAYSSSKYLIYFIDQILLLEGFLYSY